MMNYYRFSYESTEPRTNRERLLISVFKAANLPQTYIRDEIIESDRELEIEEVKLIISELKSRPDCVRFSGWDSFD